MTKDRTIRLSSLTAASECRSCGARIEADALFCPMCGAPPNGTAAVGRPLAAPAPLPPIRPEQVRAAPVVAAADEGSSGMGGKGRRRRALWIGIVGAALVAVAVAGVVAWRSLAASPSGSGAPADASGAAGLGHQPGALPGDDAIAAMVVPADGLPVPAGGTGQWAQVGEFRRTFEAGKAYDRCSGAVSPGNARRVTHEYRFGDAAVFATEAVTVFGNDADATAFFDSEDKSVPGCNQADTDFAPASVPGTDASLVATSGDAQVVRIRKGNVVATITTDPKVDWQVVAEAAAGRLGTH